MGEHPVFFGIDVGTSFIKGAGLDLDELDLRHIQRVAMPEFLGGLPPLHREVDPEAVMRAVEDVLSCLMREAPRCGGIVLCGQMQGFVLVDSQGAALSNYVSWLDQRVTPGEFDEMAGQLTGSERDDLGNELRHDIALPLLHWLKRRGALPAEATPVSLADFVAGRLSGTVPAMEPTQAAAFGALSLTRMGWHREVIARLGLDGLRWPDVRPAGSVVGGWQGVPCFVTVGDQQCALAGALLGDREVSVNVGTGAQVSVIVDCISDSPNLNVTQHSPSPDGRKIRPYFDGRFLATITHIPGGRALRSLVGLLSEIGGASEEEAWSYIESAVASVASTDVRAGIAFHAGPCGSTGFLENLHEGNLEIGHVFRAVFESMARNYETCARRLSGRLAEGVVFSGGVLRRMGLLRELTASAMELPHRVSPHPEDTLFGLLVLALATSKDIGVREASELIRNSKKY